MLHFSSAIFKIPLLILISYNRPKEWEQCKVYKMQVPNVPILLPFLKAFSNMYVNLIGNLKKVLLFVGKWRIFMHRPCLAGAATRPYSNGPSRPFPPLSWLCCPWLSGSWRVTTEQRRSMIQSLKQKKKLGSSTVNYSCVIVYTSITPWV